MKIILFLLASLFSYTIQGVVGLGGPLVAMPVGTILLGIDVVKPVICVVSFLSSLAIAIVEWKYINWKETVKIVGIMLGGMLLGLWLYDRIPKTALLFGYGLFAIFVACKNLFLKKEWDAPAPVMVLILFIAGLAQGLFVSGGTFMMIYALCALKEKREFRATSSMVWALSNAGMIVSQYRLFVPGPVLNLLPWTILTVAVAILIGRALESKLDQKTFRTLINILLLASGLALLLNR